MNKNWYKTAYRRNVVDMHIPDWDPSFLSQYDADDYVARLKQSKSQSAVIYAHSHAGLALYPTKVGYPHGALHGRNFVKEVFDRCDKEGIARVLYFSLIYDCAAYDHHPNWRMINRFNQEVAFDKTVRGSRYGLCCPNNPEYREYIRAYIKEICAEFDFEGIRFDMTFWPDVCFCPSCRERYFRETGKGFPHTVDWTSPEWVEFQRKREEWLNDFAMMATNTVRECQPNVTVEHQSSTYIGDWCFGVNADLTEAGDFLQGDFYGDHIQGSIARKIFSTLSRHQPYGFETSFNVALADHTAKKDETLLRCKVSACMADNGAFIFIDAVDPIGTLNPAPYEIMDRVFAYSQPYEKYLGGTRVCDVAVYLATESKFPYDQPPVRLPNGFDKTNPHFNAITMACTALIENNIPYTVITRKNLDDMSRYKVLVLADVFALSPEECAAIRTFVAQGGRLYASRYASLLDTHGHLQPDFQLADVFGVHYLGKTEEKFTYISPVQPDMPMFCGATPKYPIGIQTNQTRIAADADAEILGTCTLPYTNPDLGIFASIHSDPPGKYLPDPAMVSHPYGSGRCIYAAGALESCLTQKAVFVQLIQNLIGEPLVISDAPKPIEITLHKDENNRRYIVALLNFQYQIPNVPVTGVSVDIAVPEPVRCVLQLPEEMEIPFVYAGGRVKFSVDSVQELAMLALCY